MNLPEIEWVTRRALFALPLLVLIVAWAFYSGRGRRPLSRFPRIVRRWFTESGLSDRAPRMRRAGRGLLFGLGIVLAGLALARPQWGKIQEQSFEQQREILVALDLSQSMLAEDVPPSRLARSKLLIEGLLDALRGERVGLALFAGTAFLQSPLSADHEVMRDLLRDLDPSYIPQGGTDYAALLKTALGAFGQGDADRFLVILSDGEAHDDETWKALIPKLKERGIHVIGLGVGTTEGAVVPDATGGYLKDRRGAVVLSRLTPSTLQALARQTGGLYEDAATWVDIADVIERTVARGAKGAFAEQKAPRLRERFQVFLGPALLCLLLSYLMELPVPPHSRKLGAQDRTAKPGEFFQTSSFALPFLFLASILVLAGPVRAAPAVAPRANAAKPSASVPQPPSGSGAPATEEQPELVRIIGALAEKPEVGAQDYASMAEETLRFASEPTSASKETRASVVDDALAAVDRGEALDPEAVHWKELREKLEALRDQLTQPPPNPPQPSQSKHNQQGQSGQGAESKGGNAQGAKGDSNAEQGKQGQNAPDRQGQESQGESPKSQAAQSPGTGESSAQPKGGEGNSSPSDAASGKSGGTPPKKEPKSLDSDKAGLGGLASKDEPEQESGRSAAPSESKPPEFKEGSRVVGGGDGRDQQLHAEHPELSDALSRMEGVVDSDSPATLYQRMQKETGASAKKQSEGKNW